MWLAAGYFDESADEVEERCYTVAGYIGWQSATVRLDLKWKDLLNYWGLEYFKTSEIEFGMGAFRPLRDDPMRPDLPLSKREKSLIVDIKTSFVDLICNEELIGIAATVLLRDLMTLKAEEPYLASRLPTPYNLCGHLVMVEAAEIIINSNKREKSLQGHSLLRPIFDAHEDHSFHFHHAFPVFCQKNPKSASVILEPHYEDDKTYRCIQAADCLAYEARRLVDNHAYENVPRLRKAMDRLKDHTAVIYYLDYKTLKFLAGVQSVPDKNSIAPAISNQTGQKLQVLGPTGTSLLRG